MKLDRMLPWMLYLLVLPGCLLLGISMAREPRLDEKQTSTLLILLDGFRWDFVTPSTSPNLARLAEKGVKAEMIPVWPTSSTPNHWALATGLYPATSGLLHNQMYDPRTRRFLNPTGRQQKSGRWLYHPVSAQEFWGRGEPIWSAVARQGAISGMIGDWAGWMAEGKRPSWQVPYAVEEGARDRRAEMVLATLEQDERTRPALLTLYFFEVDHKLHVHGVGSPEAEKAIQHIDRIIGEIAAGLAERKLDKTVNIVIVADHGQMNVPKEQWIEVERFIDEGQLQTPPLDGGPLMQLWPKPGLEEKVYRSLQRVHPRIHALRSNDIPARMHCCDPATTPPVLLTTDPGWSMRYRGKPEDLTGMHGYDNQVRDMHALFIAAGPDIRAGVSVQPFENVDVYSLLTHLLEVEPAKADGSITSLCPILVEPPTSCTPPNMRNARRGDVETR